MISLVGCAISDGEIIYNFKGRILADSLPSEGLVLSLDFYSKVYKGELQSNQYRDTTITDSLGFYEYSISKGCGGSTSFGFFEETNCDERIRKAKIFISIKCRDGQWIEESIDSIAISKGKTTIPNYKLGDNCI